MRRPQGMADARACGHGRVQSVAKLVSVDDVVARRPAQALADGEHSVPGGIGFACSRPHRCRIAGTRACCLRKPSVRCCVSDLFHQNGDVEPSTSAECGRPLPKICLVHYQQGPFAHYLPYTPYTEPTLQRLAEDKPRTLATMHGLTFVGDGAQALTDLAQVMKEVLRGR